MQWALAQKVSSTTVELKASAAGVHVHCDLGWHYDISVLSADGTAGADAIATLDTGMGFKSQDYELYPPACARLSSPSLLPPTPPLGALARSACALFTALGAPAAQQRLQQRVQMRRDDRVADSPRKVLA